jgi:hypothetical protein
VSDDTRPHFVVERFGCGDHRDRSLGSSRKSFGEGTLAAACATQNQNSPGWGLVLLITGTGHQ